MKYSILQKIQILFIKAMSKIHWKYTTSLSESENDIIQSMCSKDYYIIATRRSNYLTTFFINIGHFLLTGQWGHYSHVLMNLENEVKLEEDFRFIEATGNGTHYSTFDEVFNGVSSVALIKPKNISIDEWTITLDRARNYLGRPYDNLFDLRNDLEINCVELIRLALKDTPNYDINFAEFEKLISRKKKLTPDMFVECSDFSVIFCIRK